MPRTDRPLGGEDSELVEFAGDLRRLREKAGRPSYRELARAAHYSATTLSDAAGGRRLPTLAVLRAYVQACGGDPDEWELRWRDLADQPAENSFPAPYLGLAPLQADDVERFFGRSALVDEIVTRLADERFLAVTGASGVGKSSLLRAGVVARLRSQGVTVAVMTPGTHPLQEWRSTRDAAVVVVDQFEEVFTLCPDEDERAAFIEAVTSTGRVVIGLRLDFSAHCADHPALREALSRGQILVGAMSTDELRQVVVGPAERAGCTVEGRLVAEVVAEAGGRAGVLPLVSHALLETWRRRTGQTLTLAGYREAGGIQEALAKTAEELYAAMSPRRRQLTRALMLRLTAFGEGTQDTRRRIRREELDTADPDTEAVLHALAGARLVSLDESTVELSHEALISAWPRLHSWLAGNRDDLRTQRSITQATQLWKTHGKDDGTLLRGARLLGAREWSARDGHENELTPAEQEFLRASVDLDARERASVVRRERQLRRLSNGLVVSMVVVLVVGLVALVQRREAIDAQQVAVSRQLASQAPTLLNSQPDTAMLLSVQAWNTSPTVEARGNLLSMSARAAYDREFAAHAEAVSDLAFTPDGRQLVTASRDQTLGVWDLAGHRRTASLTEHATWLRSVSISPDGATAVSVGDDRAVVLWNLGSRVRTAVMFDHTAAVRDVTFSPDGKLVASADEDGRVVLWDVARRNAQARLESDAGSLGTVAFSPDGRWLAVGGTSGAIEIWDVLSRARVGTFAAQDGEVRQVAFDPRGRYLASAGDLTVKMWDVGEDGTPDPSPRVLEGHIDEVRAVAFSRDGRTLASAGSDQDVLLWDVALGEPQARLTGHTSNIYALRFGAGSQLASAGEDGAVIVWDTTRISPVTGLADSTKDVRDLQFSPDGGLLAEAYGNQAILLDTTTRQRQAALTLDSPVDAVAFDPTGDLLATGDDDGTVVLWSLKDHTELARLEGHPAAVLDLAFSPDGKTLVSGGVDFSAIVWDVERRERRTTLAAHDGPVNGVAFSPDGRKVATGAHDGAVVIWDVSDWAPVRRLTGHTGWVRSVVFSPDSRTIASSASDSTVRLWDAEDGSARETLTGYRDSQYNGVTFSPDGRTLAFIGGESSISLWRPGTGKTWARLSGSTGEVGTLAYSPDGKSLAAALSAEGPERDSAVHFWETDAERTAQRICAGLDRDLSEDEWEQFVPDLPRQDTC